MALSTPNPSFWAGKRVLLTGHSGFKGAWAALWLEALGAKTVGLALPPESNPSLFQLAGVERRLGNRLVDIRDQKALSRALADEQFDLVLHMAAQAFVGASIDRPIETFETNVMGVANLLEVLRSQTDLKAVLVVTSDKVYANDETGKAFSETDRLGGRDPYSASKAAAELITASLAKTYFDAKGVAVATARGGNVIGGGDFAVGRLVPDIIMAGLNGKQLELRHPEATRPWQHVLDALSGYLVYLEALATRPQTPRALNFGPSKTSKDMSVGELATALQETLGAAPWRLANHRSHIEARALRLNSGRSEEILNFGARLGIKTALDWTLEWHLLHRAGYDTADICLDQITRYCTLQATQERDS